MEGSHGVCFEFAALAEVDVLDHSYLGADDVVFYLEEYKSTEGFLEKGNNLITNLKKSVETLGTDEWQYKENSIQAVARSVANEMELASHVRGKVYWVPIPPSKTKTNPLFDDRLYRILVLAIVASNTRKHFVSDVLYQTSDRESFSSATDKRVVDELVSNYLMNDISNYRPEKDQIIIFDDLLTTGCHFKAVEKVVLNRYPNADVKGFFIARRVPKKEVITPIILNGQVF